MNLNLGRSIREPKINEPNTERPAGDWQTVDDPRSHMDEPIEPPQTDEDEDTEEELASGF